MKNVALAFALLASPLLAFAEIDLETLTRDAEFSRFMSSVDLESKAFQLGYKDGGTSVGLRVEMDGKKAGKWVPTNSATNPEAQVVSYQLARFFQMSEQVVPSAYYVAGPKALATFRGMLQSAREKNKHRILNRDNTLRAINANPNAMLGVFTAPINNVEVEELVNAAANTINRNHPIASFIRADGTRPSATKRMTFKNLKNKDGSRPSETELVLAREFSRIMVLDILTGQWDRWSGGNVEAVADGNRAILVARDNGGASMSGANAKGMAKYFGIVTRFDRGQIDLLRDLKAELKANPTGVAKTLRLRSNPVSLINRVNAVLQHVDAMQARYRDAAFF